MVRLICGARCRTGVSPSSVLQRERTCTGYEQGTGVQRGDAFLHVLRPPARRAPRGRRPRTVRSLPSSPHIRTKLISPYVCSRAATGPTGTPETGASTKNSASGSQKRPQAAQDQDQAGSARTNTNTSTKRARSPSRAGSASRGCSRSGTRTCGRRA